MREDARFFLYSFLKFAMKCAREKVIMAVASLLNHHEIYSNFPYGQSISGLDGIVYALIIS